MASIYLCILKEFHHRTFICHNSLICFLDHFIHHVMPCFTHFFDDRKQDDVITNAHRKLIIELFKNKQTIYLELSTIWENTYGCAYHYIYSTALYLLSILSRDYNIIIDHDVSVPGYFIEVVYGLNKA